MPKFGWKPDAPDFRDLLHSFVGNPQPHVDLRAECPPVYDQGDLGSCTANAIAAAIRFDEMKQGHDSGDLSRLFIYYNERVIEGDPETDGGAVIRDGVKVISHQGVCLETEWPYDITKFADKPDDVCYADATKYEAVKYQRVTQNIRDVKMALSAGLPVVFGFTVYESFMSDQVAKTGIMPVPKRSEAVEGGHCVMAVGYDGTGSFIIRNSWGPDWGQGGYFLMPESVMGHRGMVSDLWTIQTVK